MSASGVPMRNGVATGDPTLQDLVVAVWRYRWRIGVLAFLAGVAGFAASYLITPVYRAEVVLLQASDSGSGVGGLATQLGGLAALVGISTLSGGGINEALAVLDSREFITEFIEERDITKVLYAEYWDEANQRWLEEDPPTTTDAYKFFNEEVKDIVRDTEGDTIRLSVEWTDPVLAASWANDLVVSLNGRMRERAVAESERSIAYLNRELEKTSLVAIEQAIGTLVEEQLGRIMLASTRDEFAFKVIDHAVAPEPDDYVRPRRATLAVVTLIAALAVASFIAALVDINRRFSSSVPAERSAR